VAPVTSSTSRAGHLAGLWAAAREAFGSPGRKVAFVAVALVVALAYTLLLPFDFTQRLELANWDYLTAYQATWSVVLGVGMGLVIVVQVYAMRRVAQARAATGAVGGLAFVVSLLPSFLCCTPFVPTLLAFVGISGLSLYATTGAVQHFFAVHQTELLAASVVLLVCTGVWGLHKVADATCLSDDGCGVVVPEDSCGAPPSADEPSARNERPAASRTATVPEVSGAPVGLSGARVKAHVAVQPSVEQGAR